MVMEDDTVELLTKEQAKQLEQAWLYTVSRLRDYFDGIQKVMQQWFPVVSSAHRETVSRVRTAYRRKQKAKRRRNRKR